MAEAVLSLEGVAKSFPGVRALDGVRFDVRAGEVHALLGENGAGKSTLIKIMSGVHEPDAGTLLLDGRPVRFARPQDAQRAGIATIYQELLLFPELSVAENIFLGHAPRGRLGAVDWGAMRARAREILASLDIHDLDVGPDGGGALGRQPAAGRDREGALAERARPDHGRADGGADRGRRRAAVRDRPAAEGARRRRRLHQPPAGRDLRPRRPGDGAARRALRRDAGGRRTSARTS